MFIWQKQFSPNSSEMLGNRDPEERRLFTHQSTLPYLIDHTGITYIRIHDLSGSKNGGSRLLKIASKPINLGTHTIQLSQLGSRGNITTNTKISKKCNSWTKTNI